MRDQVRVLQAAMYRPWAIHKPAIGSVLEQLSVRSSAVARMSADEIDKAVTAASTAPLGRMIGSVAVLPVCGVILQKQDFWSWFFGGTSVERLLASFRQYLNDPNVSTVVFDVDSPGGEVYGVVEAFEEILAARGQKKMIAVSNPFMASAAYWLCCAADEVVVMPSGQAGSVGCYVMHEDLSQMLERVGVDITFIQHGEHKTEGNAYEPLSDSARAEYQSSVDYYGGLFDRAVAKARDKSVGEVLANFGQGRVLRAPDAKKVGMVDRIATLDQVLHKLAPMRSRGLAAGSAMRLTLASDEPPQVRAAEDVAEPNEDGTCPDGYEKGEDGTCYLPEAHAEAIAQQQADKDAVEVVLAMTEWA